MALVKCLGCGSDVDSGAKECPKCGKKHPTIPFSKCVSCGKEVDYDAKVCPHCGKESPTVSGKQMLIAFIVFVVIIGLFVTMCSDDDTPKVPLTEKQIADKQFSQWDGSNIYVTRRIKESMNDPDSYSHVKTLYSYNNVTKTIEVRTKFRGKNAFGGTIMNTAIATVDLDGNIKYFDVVY
ncbi:MAG: zinc ribbon domain-containing protein [Campylobacteraceae bacterium]|jgi:predicted amidophosphoribosyltransferase|nr:zinc ribbon domain-containing protein [Campylobacteraceae bacterium]